MPCIANQLLQLVALCHTPGLPAWLVLKKVLVALLVVQKDGLRQHRRTWIVRWARFYEAFDDVEVGLHIFLADVVYIDDLHEVGTFFEVNIHISNVCLYNSFISLSNELLLPRLDLQ